MEAKPKPNLLRMPLVILRLILEDLHASSRWYFYNFRLVSRACRIASEFLLFRNVALHDETLVAKSRSIEMAKKMIDQNGSMREYVRLLRLGPFTDEEWFYHSLSPLFEEILNSVIHLQSLTWNADRAIRPAFLDAFHRVHPSAKLNVILRDRNFTQLNRALLSSPQLHTLDISIFRILDYPHPKGSELQFVKKCIGPSLRVLHLQFYDPGEDHLRRRVMQWDTVQPGPAFFDWREGDRFGPLEELSLKHDEYDLSLENCTMWAKVTSWDRLQRLDLDRGSPRHLFASLTNRAVNLKSLKFWISPPRRTSWDLHPLNSGIPILTKFIASIIALQELEFGAHDIDEFSSVLSLMLENIQDTLRVLKIASGTWAKPSWNPEQYIKVLDQTQGLEIFQAKIKDDTVEGEWQGLASSLGGSEKFSLTTKSIKALPELQGPLHPHRVGILI